MRFAVDTGGTFTDLLVEDAAGMLHMFKAPTTPADPIRGVIDALQVAATGLGRSLQSLLADGETFIYGTTHAINAIITGNTARTAFLTTEGHPDVLVLREGGRAEPFNYTVPYPEPYIPRSLTWEVPGRLRPDGSEFAPFDEAACRRVIREMKTREVQAVAVCLLWSIVNPAHELRVASLLEDALPGVPYTLSHQLNPTLREYRRASSACIDASLKPMMAAYMAGLTERLRGAGFAGRVLVVTSQGGVMDAADIAQAPIHLINSGPSMAPVSGRRFAALDEGSDTAVITDTGGTTYDVSLVRRGRIPWSRETWIGQPFRGHMTGFPSVDVRSIGAGGGSIAWIDDGGMLHVGPNSAGAVPGPVCYGQGGSRPTVTDAALVLGYVDPAFFLGGSMQLDTAAAEAAIARDVAGPLGVTLDEAAAAVITVATENMVQAILDITVNQGIDPRDAVLVGGGGAAGLNSVQIARRLETPRLVIPEVGAALSAAGALMSDLTAQFHATLFTRSADFAYARVNAVLDALEQKASAFIAGPGRGSLEQTVTFWAEARYPEQVWELEVKLPSARFAGPDDVAALVEAFHATHEDVFAIRDANAGIEIVGWSVSVACRIHDEAGGTLAASASGGIAEGARMAYFPGHGRMPANLRRFETIAAGEKIAGPAIIESSFTTVVVNPGAVAERRPSGSLSIDPGRGGMA
ncbi:MAG: hydantoinase/oxoprolinase family protein [Alphaproteobacteria bacterium]|nr:hydantoinase/oxoprolinase family protein [Alphaproteobacteria bacterium]